MFYSRLGLIYHEIKLRKECVESLVASIKIFPANWSAWDLLRKKLTVSEFEEYALPECIAYRFFKIDFKLENNLTDGIKDDIDFLTEYDYSVEVLKRTANYHYAMKDLEKSSIYFDRILKEHKGVLDSLDVYSNILFVNEETSKLANLAHYCLEINRYRPETCIVIGT